VAGSYRAFRSFLVNSGLLRRATKDRGRPHNQEIQAMTRFFASLSLALLLCLAGAAGTEALPPDPSTTQPFPCTWYQTLTFADPEFGDITGRVFRPVSGNCVSTSGPPADRPVVLLFNGNGYTYFDYDVVARHLAGNGFVVAVVQADEMNPVQFCDGPGTICIEDRARKGIAYLKLLRDNWTWADQLDFTNISLVGHSRGGEAAVEAAAIIRWEEDDLGNPGVVAVVSLAPTDVGTDGLSGRRRLLGRESPAFLVIYGSRDEQVSGISDPNQVPLFLPPQTGFALYDRAGTENSLEGFPISLDNQVEKAMQFVYLANHNQFSDRCGSTVSCSPSILACADQHKVAKGLVNAFLKWKVLGTGGYKAWFDGTVQEPWGFEIWPQFSEGDWESRRVIDNFQDGEVGTNTLGGTLSVNGNLQAEVKDNWETDLRSLHGPEDGFRLEVTHDAVSLSNILQWSIPAAKGNAASFTHLSFRIGQGSAVTGPARVNVRLRRGGAWSALVNSEGIGEIPEPDHMGTTYCLSGQYPDRTVVHMRTIRIPLASFGGDLTNLQNVQIRFDDATTLDKVLYLDNLELTGGTPILAP
jgi:dienelactone hydrolase